MATTQTQITHSNTNYVCDKEGRIWYIILGDDFTLVLLLHEIISFLSSQCEIL